jgi:hypothetical protein
MLCKVVDGGDTYTIEHVTDRYFNIGECTMCEEFAYAWYPIAYGLESSVRDALSKGCTVSVDKSVKRTKLITDAVIDYDVNPVRAKLFELYDIRLTLLNSIKTVDIYETLTVLVKTLSNDELSTKEKVSQVNTCDKFHKLSTELSDIESEIAELLDKVDHD